MMLGCTKMDSVSNVAGREDLGWSGVGRTFSAISASRGLALGRNICSDSLSVRGRRGEVAIEEHLMVMGAIIRWWDLITTLLLGRHPVRR